MKPSLANVGQALLAADSRGVDGAGNAPLDRAQKRTNPARMLPVVPVVVCCALAAISAVCVVLLKKPVHVAVALLAHSLSLAALYMSVDAQFSAVAQTLIYSGAIVVLFLIVVALLPTGGKEDIGFTNIAAGFVVFAAIAVALGSAIWALKELPTTTTAGFDVHDVGVPLFTTLIRPFELTAPLLLAGIVSAIALWRRQERHEGGAR
jgi:NADH-quinone oxidoreductase subunit J